MNKESKVDKTVCTNASRKIIGQIHIVDGSFHVCFVYKGALRRIMHTKVCIGLDIAHFLFFYAWLHHATTRDIMVTLNTITP